MKEQEFKTVKTLGAVDHVCCDYAPGFGWSLYVYGDSDNEASCREVNRLGNRMMTARGEPRFWKSLDSLVEWLDRAGVKFSDIRLDGATSVPGRQIDWTE